MKIRIPIEDYNSLRQEIRDRAENKEWNTWEVVRVKDSKGKDIRRLIHVPPKDDQYKCVQIMLCDPEKEDIEKKNLYLSLKPHVTDDTLKDEEKSEKIGVVFGRFCEILNRYFPQIKDYTVVLR